MKTTAKRTGALVALSAYAVTAFAGLGFSFGLNASAATDTNEGLTYYYSWIKNNARAERIYKAFETLDSDGSFKKNSVNYNLVEKGTIVEEDVKNYVENGGSQFPVAFGAGRDAFYMDNPDIFYADVFGVSISAGTDGSGKYVAFMDMSRKDSLYIGNIDSEAAVNEAIEKYEAALNTVVTQAKAAGSDAKTQIEFVNEYIKEHTEYDFCTVMDNGTPTYLPEADYIDTAYGALVNGKAVCGGYAKAFKAVLDRLNIPCVCVQGYSVKGNNSEFISHMWNAVKLEGQWYAVDVTWNDTAGKNDWLLIGEKAVTKDHIEEEIISSSGYKLKYPALKPYNYGNDTDDNGMEIKGQYKDNPDGNGKICTLTVTYEAKGAKKLEQEGKYLAARLGDRQEDGTIKWREWCNFVIMADFIFPGAFRYDDKGSYVNLYANTEYFQFALIDYAPDKQLAGSTYPDKPEYGDLAGKPCYYVYDEEKLTDEHISQPSVPYHNEGFGTYMPAPGANATPSNGGALNVNGTYEMKFVYTEKLELAEGKTMSDVKMNVETSRGNDTIKDSIEITNFNWDGDRTITFTFKPSKMFIHNSASYNFTPTALIGVNSKKIPDPVTYCFKGKSVVCSKVFNDGRLYMNVFGAPKILDTSDLSLNDFKDANGNYYAKDQRSQLLLVADRPDNAKSEEMLDRLETDKGIAKEDVITTATYEISLQICGVVKKVPNGSYMQVAFGFPEGFSPEDKDTTFKIYHYKHDAAGNITGVEEIPVIITEYGLIAKVTSFSPFTVVQVKKSAVTESGTKTVYLGVSGNGGTIKNDAGNSGITEVTGDTVTYNITAEDGYQVDKVMLNGKALENIDKNTSSVQLEKSALKEEGNTLEVSFIRSAAAESYKTKGIELKTPDTIILSADDIAGYFPVPESGSNATAVAVTVGVLAVVLAGSALAIYIAVVKTRPAKRRR